MNKREFLAVLAQEDTNNWHLTVNGAIRNIHTNKCLIMAAGRSLKGNKFYHEVAKRLNLSTRLYRIIVNAADNNITSKLAARMRTDLLRVLNLQENTNAN